MPIFPGHAFLHSLACALHAGRANAATENAVERLPFADPFVKLAQPIEDPAKSAC